MSEHKKNLKEGYFVQGRIQSTFAQALQQGSAKACETRVKRADCLCASFLHTSFGATACDHQSVAAPEKVQLFVHSPAFTGRRINSYIQASETTDSFVCAQPDGGREKTMMNSRSLYLERVLHAPNKLRTRPRTNYGHSSLWNFFSDLITIH